MGENWRVSAGNRGFGASMPDDCGKTLGLARIDQQNFAAAIQIN